MTAAGHPKISVIPVIAVMPSGKTAHASTERIDSSILSSECAFSCKMKLEVMKRQGFRTDLTSSQLGTKLQTDDIVEQCFGIGKTTVQPFIRINGTDAADFTDGKRGKIALTPAMELSFMKRGEQEQPLIFCFRLVNAAWSSQ